MTKEQYNQNQQLIREQNQALDELKKGTEGLKKVASEIGAELDNQLEIIEELREEVNKNGQKLKEANRKTKELNKKMGSRCLIM